MKQWRHLGLLKLFQNYNTSLFSNNNCSWPCFSNGILFLGSKKTLGWGSTKYERRSYEDHFIRGCSRKVVRSCPPGNNRTCFSFYICYGDNYNVIRKGRGGLYVVDLNKDLKLLCDSGNPIWHWTSFDRLEGVKGWFSQDWTTLHHSQTEPAEDSCG